jgi:hypothetical protein
MPRVERVMANDAATTPTSSSKRANRSIWIVTLTVAAVIVLIALLFWLGVHLLGGSSQVHARYSSGLDHLEEPRGAGVALLPSLHYVTPVLARQERVL